MRQMRPILVVDDNHDDVFFLQRALADWGIKNPVQAVYGGKESLSYLCGDPPYNDRERFPLPLLILLDLKMPDVGGMEVLRWIRQQPALKIMCVALLSSVEDMAKSHQAYELQADSVLVKPLNYAKAPELAQTVRRLLARC
jgi:CheY-like chemotaxis protein